MWLNTIAGCSVCMMHCRGRDVVISHRERLLHTAGAPQVHRRRCRVRVISFSAHCLGNTYTGTKKFRAR